MADNIERKAREHKACVEQREKREQERLENPKTEVTNDNNDQYPELASYKLEKRSINKMYEKHSEQTPNSWVFGLPLGGKGFFTNESCKVSRIIKQPNIMEALRQFKKPVKYDRNRLLLCRAKLLAVEVDLSVESNEKNKLYTRLVKRMHREGLKAMGDNMKAKDKKLIESLEDNVEQLSCVDNIMQLTNENKIQGKLTISEFKKQQYMHFDLDILEEPDS